MATKEESFIAAQILIDLEAQKNTVEGE